MDDSTTQFPRLARREFLRNVAAASIACSAAVRASDARAAREIAFTFDDPSIKGGGGLQWRELNERILRALARHKVRAALFVCGMRIDSPEGRELVSSWDQAGHLICNHSYSHLDFNSVPLSEFEADALKCEPLIQSYPRFTRLFRFPYFKEGDTREKRDGMRAFLKSRGYRAGRATIDATDWAISARLEKRVAQSAAADLSGYRDFFLQHIAERAQYYDSLATRLRTQPIRHTLLLHHNALNALFLDDLIGHFEATGWRPIDAHAAYQDRIYDREPQILPAGESLLWALAKESGRFDAELRYPGEDDSYENPKLDALKL